LHPSFPPRKPALSVVSNRSGKRQIPLGKQRYYSGKEVVPAGLANWFYDSPDAALAHLRSERLSLYPRMIDVGTGVPGEARESAMGWSIARIIRYI